MSLKVVNFRSFGEKEVKKIRFNSGMNFIVGENNVGKSNLLRALEVFKGNYAFDVNDWNSGDKDKEISMELDADLSNEEFKALLKGPESIGASTSLKAFGKRLRFDYLSTGRGLRIRQEKKDKQRLTSRDINTDETKSVLELIGRKLKIFSEVRKRPSGEHKKILESYDGSNLADVLANLKMGTRIEEREKFELIKQKFAWLFPNLLMDVTRESPNAVPRIVIQKKTTKHEIPIDYAGAGIGEMIIFLTHLIPSEDMIFGLDMPELHFHPHAQRLLLEILKQQAENNQILVVTHSPLFVETKDLDNVIIVREEKGETTLSQLPENFLKPEEIIRMRRQLDVHNREFFFSRASLIVEGQTEVGAMPIFSKALESDFDKHGISLVRTGKHLGVFVKLLKGLDFPYFAMCDRDALMNVEGSIEVDGRRVKTSPVFYDLYKIGLLREKHTNRISSAESKISTSDNKEVYPDDLFEELHGIAETYDVYVLPSDFEGVLRNCGYDHLLRQAKDFSNSKVTQGVYVAERIIEDSLKVPQEFQYVIKTVMSKTL